MYRRWKEGKSPKIQLTPEVLDDVLNELESIRKAERRVIAGKLKKYWVNHLKILALLLEFPNVPEDWFIEYALLDELETLKPSEIYIKKSIIKDCIEYLKRDSVVIERKGKLIFNGDQFDMIYLKYLCASRDIRAPKDFYTGFLDEPLVNLHYKLINVILLRDFQEYRFQTLFDHIERINGEVTRRLSLIGGRALGPLIVEISPKTHREFYLGAPNSIRFRININWLRAGFVIQIKFKDDKSLAKFTDRLNSLKDKFELLGYRIIMKDEISWNLEGSEYLKKGKIDEAINCFDKAIELNPLFELPWLNKASTFLRIKDYEKALEHVNKALELHPRWADALRLKGVVLINLKRNDEAVGVLRKAVKINPEDWRSWDSLGRALFNLRKYEEALECFEKALKINPNNYELYYLKGLTLMQLGRLEDSINVLSTALGLKPSHIPSLMLKARLLLNEGKYEEALEILDTVLEKEPENIEALLVKGLTLSRLNRYREAIECCDEVLRIDENNAFAWYIKACFTAKRGSIDEALRYLRKALELDENLINEAVKDEDLASLREHEEFQKLTKSFRQSY